MKEQERSSKNNKHISIIREWSRAISCKKEQGLTFQFVGVISLVASSKSAVLTRMVS